MNTDEYKELMLFHMLCHKDSVNANWISVDDDGKMYWYEDKPDMNLGGGIWSNSSTSINANPITGGLVCRMSIPDDWTQTLVEL